MHLKKTKRIKKRGGNPSRSRSRSNSNSLLNRNRSKKSSNPKILNSNVSSSIGSHNKNWNSVHSGDLKINRISSKISEIGSNLSGLDSNWKTNKKTPVIFDMNYNFDLNVNNFLKSNCDDSYYCMALGIDKAQINEYFSFNTFDNLIDVKTIFDDVNLKYYILKYEKLKNNAYALLKINNKEDANNLFMEAYNGINYINNFNKFYPCFLETYGYYKVIESKEKKKLKPTVYSIKNQLKEISLLGLDKNPTSFSEIVKESCNNLSQVVLTEYTNNEFKNLNVWLKDYINKYHEEKYDSVYEINNANFGIELSQILFQIYSVLYYLNEITDFTHNNLNMSVVMIYELPYVTTFKYKTHINMITIQTKYLVKITSYNKVYTNSNIHIYNAVCNNPKECYEKVGDKCGTEVGYKYLGRNENYNPLISNKSRDLSLLLDILQYFDKYLINEINQNIAINVPDHFYKIFNDDKFLLIIYTILNNVDYQYVYGMMDPESINIKDLEHYKGIFKYILNNNFAKEEVRLNIDSTEYDMFLSDTLPFGDEYKYKKKILTTILYELKDKIKIKSVGDVFYLLQVLLSNKEWKEKNTMNHSNDMIIKNVINIDLTGQIPMSYT